jgi:CDP-glycerol glycerophosphotransferase (TagB/SpsB family)
MIFFTYDLEDYKQERGLMGDFEEDLPGPMVKKTDTIIELIKNTSFDLTIVDYYAEKWNQYSKGSSSQNLVRSLFTEHRLKSKGY